MDGMLPVMDRDDAAAGVLTMVCITSGRIVNAHRRVVSENGERTRLSDLEYVTKESVSSGSRVRLPQPQGWPVLALRR